MLRLLVRLAPPDTPRIDSVSLDSTAFAFALGATALVGLLFGLLPAIKGSRVSLTGALRHGNRTVGGGGLGLRRALIVSEVALSLALLVGAGLLTRTLLALAAVEPGFDTERLLAAQLVFSEDRYPERGEVRERLAEIERRMRSRPGVESVGSSSVLPLINYFSDVGIAVEGLPEPGPEEPAVQFSMITPALLPTMGVALREGRLLDERDGPDDVATLLVNEAFVQRRLGGRGAIGRRLRLGSAPDAPWRTVVGVVSSVHHGGLQIDPEPQVYLPHAQLTARGMQLVVRAKGDPADLVPTVQAVLREIDPQLAALRIRTGREIVGEQLAMPRFLVLLLGSFAAAAMALAAVGIYGLMAFLVAQRRREIGVRLALGAEPREVLAMVVRQGVGLAAAGVALGVVASLALSRGLGSLLYAVEPSDPVTLTLAAGALLVAAAAACLVPALAAARVHPALTLRGE